MDITLNIDKAREIQGWMNDKELEFLAERASKSLSIVEFGCYKGRSTRAMADNMPDYAKLYAVDPWNGTYFADDGSVHDIKTDVYEEFEHNLRDHIEKGRVIPFKTHSKDFLKSVGADFVFIDGDHRFLEVLNDIKIALTLLRKSGIIAGHDFTHNDWPGVRHAVEFSFKNDFKVVESIWWRKV